MVVFCGCVKPVCLVLVNKKIICYFDQAFGQSSLWCLKFTFFLLFILPLFYYHHYYDIHHSHSQPLTFIND